MGSHHSTANSNNSNNCNNNSNNNNNIIINSKSNINSNNSPIGQKNSLSKYATLIKQNSLDRLENQIRGKNKDTSDEEKKPRLKILTLGSNNSGKSTFIKQINILYNGGYTKDELSLYKPYMRLNLTQIAKDMITFTQTREKEIYTSTIARNAWKKMSGLCADNIKISKELLKTIWDLWNDNQFKLEFTNATVQKREDMVYLIENSKRILMDDYIPTVEDILRCKAQTSGTYDTTIEDNNCVYTFVDVGGQKCERKKWIHQFEDVGVILFFVSMNDYDYEYDDLSTSTSPSSPLPTSSSSSCSSTTSPRNSVNYTYSESSMDSDIEELDILGDLETKSTSSSRSSNSDLNSEEISIIDNNNNNHTNLDECGQLKHSNSNNNKQKRDSCQQQREQRHSRHSSPRKQTSSSSPRQSTNRLQETFDLFEETINNRWFYNTPVVLLLNKCDLFVDKLKTVPLAKYFPDYTGKSGESVDATAFISQQFRKRDHYSNNKRLFIHSFNATESNQIGDFIDYVKRMMLICNSNYN
ncbi:G-protein subunit alpha 11 [Cavenderia fasciculata]|uniref:G-protein subunit alpha 11 n=1 Tax=Cavenderia fasciculata TaxID=261658 RepID=F4Q251_CACFS|nr:G-protein subunit alpha 11 [Cavenderia fasciculata]EGG18071.1 G-protein subunit alpha 11 [Cavenderia fasciculata]|eukprot:XP_004356964.1 G-protein subunit alpha 11 [Cavenderia fasciculata]